jgi:cell division protein FtsA
MAKPKSGLITVLDVGSTKIACVIARIRNNGEIEVKGVGHHSAQGFRAGAITDIKMAETSILAAVESAERMAETAIEKVIVSISGATIKSHHVNARMNVSGHMVTERDIARIISQSLSRYKQPVVHYVPLDYAIDGTGGIKDPVSMCGDVLTSRLHIITASQAILMNLSNCLARCQLDIDGFMVASYAAGLACLTEDEMDLGCTIIDMGGTVTSFAVFRGGNIIHTEALPVGGWHVTTDMAQGLSTSLTSAERIKTLYGHVISTSSDNKELIDIPFIGEEHTDTYQVPRSLLVSIIRPRVEEILEMVQTRLKASGFEAVSGKNIVLTGGASQLMGLKELATFIFGKQVRLGNPEPLGNMDPSLYGAGFSTALGMLRFAANRTTRPPVAVHEEKEEKKGTPRRLWRWLQENF